MRAKIILIDFLISATLSLVIMCHLAAMIVFPSINVYYINYMNAGIALFYYTVIKAVCAVIICVKNILRKNIVIRPQRTLLWGIPSVLFIAYIVYFMGSLFLRRWHVGAERVIASAIMITGCLSVLACCVFNKTLTLKTTHKAVLAIIQPLGFFWGYWVTWLVIAA